MNGYDRFFDELVDLEVHLWTRLEQGQAERGTVSVAQLMALRSLHGFADSGRVHDLAAALQITVGASSKLVDRLVRDGLAERRPHPTDRRSMLIALTPAGREAHRKAADERSRGLRELLGDTLSESSAAELAETMSAVLLGLTSKAARG